MTWSPDRVEACRKLWFEGYSASQVANELGGGISRNAVVGLVHRKGWERAKSSMRSANARGLDGGKTRSAISRFPAREKGKTRAQSVDPIFDDPLATLAPIGPRISITELRDSTCRWPIGDPGNSDFGYCGALPKPNYVYCPYHCRISYVSVSDKRAEAKEFKEAQRELRRAQLRALG